MMKTKRLFMLALTLALVTASVISTAATAGDAVVPFKATYTTYPEEYFDPSTGVITVEIPGEGQANHLGESIFSAEMLVYTTSYPWTQNGEMTLRAANGDEFSGDFEGYAVPTSTGVEFWGEFWITSGTGRLEGVTGSGTYQGFVVGDTGTLYFNGTLTK